jgi:folate-dependent phosphoribosylglycinamide formyltransferase PurN
MSYKKIGWFSSGGGSGSRGMLLEIANAISHGALNASIEFLFCNREYGEDENTDQFFKIADQYNIPIITISSSKYKKLKNARRFSEIRDSYDEVMLEQISKFNVDFSVAAGYGLIFSDQVVENMVILNLHPATPSGPIGTWQQVITNLIDNRAVEHGLMVHVATSDMDRGPVLTYITFPIVGNEYDRLWENMVDLKDDAKVILFNMIRYHGLMREPILLLKTMQAFTEDRFDSSLLRNKKYLNCLTPICLNDEFT